MLSTLPAHESQRLHALNIALREELERLYDADDVVRTLSNALACPQELLGVLADVLKPVLWSNSLSEQQKRQLLASTTMIRRTAGTLSPVALVVDAMGLVARVEEWYEFGGAPGLFRVVIESIGSEYSDADIARLEALINRAKRLSAHLLEIQVQATIESAQLYVGTFIHIFEEIRL